MITGAILRIEIDSFFKKPEEKTVCDFTYKDFFNDREHRYSIVGRHGFTSFCINWHSNPVFTQVVTIEPIRTFQNEDLQNCVEVTVEYKRGCTYHHHRDLGNYILTEKQEDSDKMILIAV